jgi:RNA polymerase sigma-70 factor (sigma-E family)
VESVQSQRVTATFDETFQAEHARLARLAHLLTGSNALGEELLQEAFISLHRRWDDVDNPAAYVRATLINLTRSAQRRQRLERRHSSSLILAPELPPEIDEMWRLIQRLPAKQRAVVVLRFYEDRSLPQIAGDLGRPLGTVKSLLYRALRRLKEEMQ